MGIYIGIDPGASGAICILKPELQEIQFLPTPGAKISPGDLYCDLVSQHAAGCDAACIEDVHSIHGMSAKSNFQFGYNVGMVTAVLEAAGLELWKVTPKVWQKKIGAPSSTQLGKLLMSDYKLKQAIADIASLLYPTAELYGPKGGLLDGRSDALMIAHFIYKHTEELRRDSLQTSLISS